jgi:RNA polymerase sigma factor (sigma-70 family)
MMAAAGDSEIVRRHDEEKLRRFVRCRDTGDVEGAQRWWAELVEDNIDRVKGMVAIWGRDGRLSADEREEAAQQALFKLWRNMVKTFEGSSMGEWVNAVRRCTEYACMDVQRSAARRRRHESSLDETVRGEEGEVGRHDRQLGKRAEEEYRRAEERDDAAGFVAWAVPQVANERRRTVIERSLDGAPAEEIAAELGVEMGNLYQLRSRGMKDLAKLKETYDP